MRTDMLWKMMLPGDEELGKKDDDFQQQQQQHHHHHHHHYRRFVPARHPASSTWGHTFRWRRRRLLLVVASLVTLYLLLWRTIGGHGTEHPSRLSWSRPGDPSVYQPPYRTDHPGRSGDEPIGSPPGTSRSQHSAANLHTYDGQVRFFRLASTLRASALDMDGYDKRNRNVLFVMSSLASAAALLPMICDMSVWRRNNVHVAFMGREDMSLQHLLDVNGVDQTACSATWHDARPDYAEYSSDSRFESAVKGAMSHINSFLHPQAVIMGDTSSEDDPFMHSMHTKTKELDITLIQLPKERSEELTWMMRLDSGSLRNWYKPMVDIVIQVPPGSSSVLGLLKSIEEADYSGLAHPRIILELPADLDDSVSQRIADFKWPPDGQHERAESALVIRRRISSRHPTPEEAAVHFLELFYPVSIASSHVLMLSHQVQLAPQYFQFVQYNLLEYKYSFFGIHDSERLMGVSLELPKYLLDEKTELKLPTLSDMHTERNKELYPETKNTPFLWQAPNNHATLFFGDKWVELHSFLFNWVEKHHQSATPTSRAKFVSEILPSWMEYVLELMRVRGYSFLYPASTSSNALVIVHNELYRTPEEFVPSSPANSATESAITPMHTKDAFSHAERRPGVSRKAEASILSSSTPLHFALPFNGDLPEIPHLPQLLYDGTQVNPTMVLRIADEYADEFRKEVGGCNPPRGKRRKIVKGEAGDLFCFGNEDSDDWVEDGTPESLVQGLVRPEAAVVSTASIPRETT